MYFNIIKLSDKPSLQAYMSSLVYPNIAMEATANTWI